jgi:hypothetical protein
MRNHAMLYLPVSTPICCNSSHASSINRPISLLVSAVGMLKISDHRRFARHCSTRHAPSIAACRRAQDDMRGYLENTLNKNVGRLDRMSIAMHLAD